MSNSWSHSEIDAIVKDYFVMLKLEQTGKAYSKAERWRALMKKTGRTRGAIEYKHMNISAVMDALGLPYINGYKPYTHLQHALFVAVVSHLNERPVLHNLLKGQSGTLRDDAAEYSAGEPLVVDEAPPQRGGKEKGIPKEIERIIRTFENPAERDARNRNLGKAGESLVYEHERHRLQELGRGDLSDNVRWVARDDGDGYGFDILSFSGKGDKAEQELWLEVKTTNGSATTPFYITRNELQVSKQRPDVFRVFRLYDFRMRASAYCLAPPLDKYVSFTPTIFRASF